MTDLYHDPRFDLYPELQKPKKKPKYFSDGIPDALPIDPATAQRTQYKPPKIRSGSGLSVRGTTYVPPTPTAPTENELRTMPLARLKQLAMQAEKDAERGE
jgi:hypothetical protein